MILAGAILYCALAVPLAVLHKYLRARIAEFAKHHQAREREPHPSVVPRVSILAIRLRSDFVRRSDARRVAVVDRMIDAYRMQPALSYRPRI
jgi:hypothetical protein